jgi:hypothetical protein
MVIYKKETVAVYENNYRTVVPSSRRTGLAAMDKIGIRVNVCTSSGGMVYSMGTHLVAGILLYLLCGHDVDFIRAYF